MEAKEGGGGSRGAGVSLTGAMFEHVNMARSHQGEQKWILWMEEGKQGSAPDQGEASGGKEARHTGTGGQRLLIRPAPDLNWLTLREDIEAAETQKGGWSSHQGGKDMSAILHCGRQGLFKPVVSV